MPDKLDGDFLLVQEDKIAEVEAKLHDTYYTEPLTIRPYQDHFEALLQRQGFHKLFPGPRSGIRRANRRDPYASGNLTEMKWLSAGLTFVNVATFVALAGGNDGARLEPDRRGFLHACRPRCRVSRLSGDRRHSAARPEAEAAPSATSRSQVQAPATARRTGQEDSSRRSRRRWRYRSLWFWIIAACFAIFAVRSFCWLIYWDGNDLKVQSPNNLGDLSLHLTYIKHFASGVPLWPDNPIEPFSKLRYPAGTSIYSTPSLPASAVDVIRGLVWTGLLASVATFYALYRWGGNFGIAAFLFNGGLGQLIQCPSGRYRASRITRARITSPGKAFALSMFVTQRGLLYAFPVALLLLYQWRARFFPDVPRSQR